MTSAANIVNEEIGSHPKAAFGNRFMSESASETVARSPGDHAELAIFAFLINGALAYGKRGMIDHGGTQNRIGRITKSRADQTSPCSERSRIPALFTA